MNRKERKLEHKKLKILRRISRIMRRGKERIDKSKFEKVLTESLEVGRGYDV